MESAVVDYGLDYGFGIEDVQKFNKKEFCKQQALERLGQTRINSLGSKMWVISYTNSMDILVQFENGYVTKTQYQSFCNGNVKNPNDISVFGHGYVGVGSYKTSIEGKHTQQYIIWSNMMQRAYSSKYQQKRPTYRECSVAPEWLNFQVFAKWYDENYYQTDDGSIMNLDKDILFKNNKIYSKDTCIFVPQSINALFIKSNGKRGLYPLGVQLQKSSGKFLIHCSIGKGKLQYLGTFDTPNEAFNSYKNFKENHIKQTADKYKNQIPQKLYDAMYSYTVEITD